MSNETTECSYSYESASTIHPIISAIQGSTATSMQRCALVTLTLQFSSKDEVGMQSMAFSTLRSQRIAHSTQYYLQSLRRLVRKRDKVFLLNSTFYFVLFDANIEGARIVETRLWDALLWEVHNALEANVVQPSFMTIGHAAYSVAESNADACIATASEPCYSFDTQPEVERYSTDTLQDNNEAILDTEVISLENELTTLAHKLGIPYLSLLPRKKPEQVQRLVTLKLAQELQCYPLGRERGTLTVALSNPQDSSILSRLHQETGLRIFPVLTHPQELQTALNLLV